MKTKTGNIWDFIGKVDAICITTNGYVKRDGTCPMGRGIAKEALSRYPKIDKILGLYLKQYGNRPFKLVKEKDTWICSFPTKEAGLELSLSFCREQEFLGKDYIDQVLTWAQGHYRKGDIVPGYHLQSNKALIQASAEKLVLMADKFNWKKIILPPPGCGNGGLSWPTILPFLSCLDDRFIVVAK